ncbi:hypothetical protein KC343_g650 [Hortaea werneckii]|nr:hypothetical protein KC323_g9517 [Hortaea werneckii]KAI6862193.1 hypothetical protein KC338_g6325 [Hortaea werneckii]KAI7244517.1 hypothetical protein KC352_g14478 [Hortaea werneckii]KAI7571460.1 hypothetical protein KC317_g1611 [Hortaea werneckii]KAI7627699.1 hypothetical protein KC346_g610 [Hortaea werneckii]
MDNPQELDGADINAVRQHFLKWRKHAVREEQGSRSEIRARGGNPESDPNRLAFRYNYCVQVDEVSLQSIISTDPEDVFGEAWVHVIHANWNLEAIQRLKEEGRLDDIQMGLATELCDDSDDMHPPIDGCTEEDVGWMRVYYGTCIGDHQTYVTIDLLSLETAINGEYSEITILVIRTPESAL